MSNADALVPGGIFYLTNVGTGTVMWANNITGEVMGYLGAFYTTLWKAFQYNNGTWTFCATGNSLQTRDDDEVCMGFYGGPSEGSILAGVPNPQAMVFDVWPVPNTNEMTINVHNTNLLLELEHPWEVTGIKVVLAENTDSDVQKWYARRWG